MKLCCMQNSVPSKPNGDIFLAWHEEIGLAYADKIILWSAQPMFSLFEHCNPDHLLAH